MNRGYLFYHKYYDSDDSAHFQAINRALFETELPDEEETLPEGACSFCMKVGYPGLLVGAGLLHPANSSSEAIKVGFYFDYTTGMPYITGSAVKGVLLSLFKDSPQCFDGLDGKRLLELRNDIFGSSKQSGRDIFFDAVPVGVGRGGLLGDDYITPHGSTAEELLKNPTPIKIMKVMPEVVYEFRFMLFDSVLEDGSVMKAEDKLELFRKILSFKGIGAKTNVGYGNLVPCDRPEKGSRGVRAKTAPMPRQDAPSGYCRVCGKKTQLRNGVPYEYCYEHRFEKYNKGSSSK